MGFLRPTRTKLTPVFTENPSKLTRSSIPSQLILHKVDESFHAPSKYYDHPAYFVLHRRFSPIIPGSFYDHRKRNKNITLHGMNLCITYSSDCYRGRPVTDFVLWKKKLSSVYLQTLVALPLSHNTCTDPRREITVFYYFSKR